MATNYPQKTCDIVNLVKHPKSVASALQGIKTQQRRDGVYAHPGDTFELDSITFVITELKRQPLGEMTDADAMAEGYPNLAAYKNIILNMHKGMTWNNDTEVWVHCFKRIQN